MSKQHELIRMAFEKGFTIDEFGIVFNKKGKPVLLSETNKGYLTFNLRYDRTLVTRVWVHKFQAYVKFGEKVFEEGWLILGRPAKAIRPLTPEELAFLDKSAENYLLYQSWYEQKGAES